MAISIHKPAIAALICLIIPGRPLPAQAHERKVPVLERRHGGYIHLGEDTGIDSPKTAGRQRAFHFDRPSPKGLLRTREAARRRLLGIPAAQLDTWNVVLIRVSFETDRSGGLTSMRTEGDFDMTPDGGSIIDPTPHNKAYFASHMEALARYFRFQSCGTLEIEYEILPEGDEESYKLGDIADYGPGRGGQWDYEGLVSFVRDAVVECDNTLRAQGYQKRISDYDAIVLAHAGANLQSDVLGNSPNDIPSFFAFLGDEDRFTIEDGQHTIIELSVIPETAIQDGYNGGIAAVLAHEFGHQLGLPDLYDVYTNYSTIGVFDNMDSGGQLGAIIVDEEGGEHYAEGFMPGGLSAWSKYLLGWASADTVLTFDNDLALPASGKCPAELVRVEITGEEYFLVENRAAELDGLYTGFVSDSLTGVILGTGNCMNCSGGFPEEFEWEYTNGYDLLLPTESAAPGADGGPGLLVWHIDEGFIARRWVDNEVNSRWPFGVSLVEAGGVVDLGDPYSRYSLGWYDDAFYDGNATELSDSTIPSSWSNWQVPSGVRLEKVSGRDTLMTFGAGRREVREVKDVPGGVEPARFGILQLPGGFRSLIVDEDGNGWMAGETSPVFSIGRAPITPVSLAPDFDSSTGEDAVIVADEGGTIHAYRDGNWTQCSGSWPVELDSLATHPVTVQTESEIFTAVAGADGSFHLLGSEGLEAAGSPIVPFEPPAKLTGNMVVRHNESDHADGIYALATDPNTSHTVYLFLIDISSGSPVIDPGFLHGISVDSGEMGGQIYLVGGDMIPEMEGSEVCVTFCSSGRILVYGRNGLISRRSEDGSIIDPPALQDMNGDGRIDIVYSDGERIFAVDPSGSNLTGWPREINGVFVLPARVSVSTPITTGVTDSGAWIAAGTDAGIAFLFDHEGGLAPGNPKKIAGSLSEPLDIVRDGDEGLFAWTDLIFNDDDNPYSTLRPEGGRAGWREGPFRGIDEGASWTSSFGGPLRTSWAHGSSGFLLPQPSWADLDGNLVVYPNPAKGNRVAFHFTAPLQGEAVLQIMTLTGEIVMEKSMQLSGGQAEITMSMGGKASGIYLGRLEIRSGTSRVEAFRKFAIVN
jgi:M6 family metalloprotease-like protein